MNKNEEDDQLTLAQFIAKNRVMYAFLPEDDKRTANEYVADELVAAGWVQAEWEYGWEADEEKRSKMVPRGPKIMPDDHVDTPEDLARFPKGRRVKRTKAGPWIDAEEV